MLSLRRDLVAGRLTMDEFAERVELAYRAQTGRDLVRAREGLPDAVPERARRRRRLTLGLFGHVVRRGRLRLRRRTLVVSAFSDVDLDLREAEIDGPTLVLQLFVFFGNVDVYVPEGIDVEARGAVVFGRVRDWGRDVARGEVPTVHVRTGGLFGTVDVWRVPRGVHGGYGEIIERVREQQKHLPT